jgi:hypothetical protein
MCSAARSARSPALTDDVSTLDVSTQANGQHPEVLFINGAQSVLALISLNGACSLTKPLETRLKAVMNAYFYFHVC